MSLPHRILNKRPALVLLFTLFSLIEAVWSWTNIIRGSRHHTDLITALFSLFLTFIAASIACRSSLGADRIIFGTIAVVGALISVRAAPLAPMSMLAVDVVKSSMWSFSALVSLIILVRGFGSDARGKPS